jgi:hypothetical protein
VRANERLQHQSAALHETGGRPTTVELTPSTSTSLTTTSRPAARASRPTLRPTEAFVVLDWEDDRLVGIEILDASSRLH